jgi:hypothetical protein
MGLACCAGFAVAALAGGDDASRTPHVLGEGNPTVVWDRILPTVVRSDRTTPVTLTVKITNGVPDRVALVFQDSSELALHDDGANGDALAGDGVYSVLVPAARVTANLQVSDVLRKFVAFVDVYVGNTRFVRVNTFSQVWTRRSAR